MKLKELYAFIIQQGIKQDPRGEESAREVLSERKERYEKLPSDQKDDFDVEMLTNPYADSRILNGSGDEELRSLLVGIDMETAEVLLAHTLRSSGKPVDAILTHHPEGKAYATFYEVIGMQADILHQQGVPLGAAESLTEDRLKEVGRKVKPQNHFRAVDAARLLGLPFLSSHTPVDNQVASFLQHIFDQRKPKYLGDVLKILKEQPEYREAERGGAGPFILAGGKEDRAGKIFVDMTGGTEGSKELIEKLAAADVGTVVGMHMSEEHYKEARKHHLRVVIAGHISSDNLGMNLMLDACEKKFGDIQVLECSGFRRHRRT